MIKQSDLHIPTDLRDIGHWRNPTIPQIRDTIQAGYVAGSQFPAMRGVGKQFEATQTEVENIGEAALEAVRAGRLIDFGYLPNAALIEGGVRGGPLYTRGALGHPFRDPWVFCHSWEEAYTVYLVSLVDFDQPAGGRCEVTELQPVTVKDRRLFLIGDRALLDPDMEVDDSKYAALSVPSPWRFVPGLEEINNGKPPEEAAAGNVLDPLMTALLILNTNGVERQTIRADAKLNRAREKARKPPIPPYDRVHAAPYVTAILARGRPRQRGEGQGGTHASPIPHLRRGHLRSYPNGHKTFIRDSLVRVSPEARAAWMQQRSHYTAGQP